MGHLLKLAEAACRILRWYSRWCSIGMCSGSSARAKALVIPFTVALEAVEATSRLPMPALTDDTARLTGGDQFASEGAAGHLRHSSTAGLHAWISYGSSCTTPATRVASMIASATRSASTAAARSATAEGWPRRTQAQKSAS